jgi:hypothetical protein
MQGTAAAVISFADEQRARADSAAWARFADAAGTAAAGDPAALWASWLALLAGRVAHARAALLLIGDSEAGPFGVAAAWPDAQLDLHHLAAVAERTLQQRQGVVAAPDGGEAAPDGAAHVGYPLLVAGRLHGAVVFDVAGASGADLQDTLRQIHWASAWMVDHFRQQALQRSEAELARVAMLNEVMASALQQRQLQASVLAVANEVAARLHCDRVAVGFEQGDRVTPLALSHTATFDTRSDLARALGEAMDEVLDLGQAVAVPRPAEDELGAIAHEQAALTLGVTALLSVPLVDDGRTVGVMTLERRAGPPFTALDQRLAAALGVMLGPTWALQHENERPWPKRFWAQCRNAGRAIAGPRHPGIKLLVGTLGVLALVLGLWQTDYRVSARTVVEGASQRASVAPFDGFIAESLVRAGESVRQGQLMARLEDRELQLERTRWAAEREQAQRRFQVALSQADRGAMGVLAAQSNQAQAQLALVDEKLARARLLAPFDGVVVSGDLRQRIGTPVELGTTLFEVAPAQGFRVVLQVEDRDIARVAVGQTGELVLSSLPDQALAFSVDSVTSVATPADGRNVFRVEARVHGSDGRLRPGMEGVGKVVVGERSLLWIWTHAAFDWLRLALWSWTP